MSSYQLIIVPTGWCVLLLLPSGWCRVAARGMSAADRLDIPAAEICLFLSLFQQQLEAGAGPYLLPLSESLCLPASLVVCHLTLCVYCHHFFLSLSCLSYCISFALCALQRCSAVERCWVCWLGATGYSCCLVRR